MSGIYDRADQRMYVKKEAEQGIYWLEYEKGTYSLKSRTVTLKEKRELEGEVLLEENTLDHAAVCCQPVYECYKEGEILLDVQGNPIPEMEQVPVYEEKEVVYQTLAKELWRPCGMHPQAAIRSILFRNRSKDRTYRMYFGRLRIKRPSSFTEQQSRIISI